MSEIYTQLENNSTLINDIERVFKDTAILAARIRNILTTGMGGNPIPLYREFKERFDFLFALSCDHKSIREEKANQHIIKWRDKPGMSYEQIKKGIILFDEYKSLLFKYQILRYN